MLAVNEETVLSVSDFSFKVLQNLFQSYQLQLIISPSNQAIPGSYWGESEAGLIGNTLYIRHDTPIHSLFHEGCHYICMDDQRRKLVNTDAEGDYDEENAVCFLQILLADEVPKLGKKRMMQDMDSWGYTFRLGSAHKWFDEDAEDALAWLQQYNIIDQNKKLTFMLRQT
jgi:hypothetical protein